MKRILLLTLLLPVFCQGQVITTIAGNGVGINTGDGGMASAASVYLPSGGVFDKYGNYFFDVNQSHKIRKISPSGTISTFAGTGTLGFSGDGGPATAAQLNTPFDVTVDTNGNLYIAETYSARIRKVDFITGIITTIAGNGVSIDNGDGGPATAAAITSGYLCFDRHGSLYISEALSYRIRKINSSGIISTFAGIGTPGFSGMGGPATAAQLRPAGICVDAAGNVYVADNLNFLIYKINTSGIISVVAGVAGYHNYNGDEIPATSAYIHPFYIALDKCGNLYVDDGQNNRIRKIDNSGIIHTVAGNGFGAPSSGGFSGDGGPATAAELFWPIGIALDSSGNMLVADTYNARIRKVNLSVCTPESIGRISTVYSTSIYPNPATTQITVTAPNKIKEVSVWNMVGQRVLTQQCNTLKTELNISQLPAAVYFVVVCDDDGGRTERKFVKQ